MNQLLNSLYEENPNSFLVKGKSFCLGENHYFLGKIRIYDDGKVIGFLSEEKSPSNQRKKIVLGLENSVSLKFWSFSGEFRGDLYSLVKDVNNPVKYYGGRGYDQPHFEQLIREVNKKLCISEIYSNLGRKPVDEILDSLSTIETGLIKSSFGNAITVKVFNYDSRSVLELISLR